MARTGSMVAAVTAGLLLVPALPASAADTTVTVDSATTSGPVISIEGTLAHGVDATGPISLGTDPSGDAAIPNAGLDIGGVTVAANPTTRRLTYSIQVFDMIPAANQSAPFYGYTLPLMVNQDDSAFRFLAAGNAGASFPPATGAWYALCAAPPAGYECPTVLTGTMGASGITITVPYSAMTIQPGALVEPGSAVGCSGVCSTLWAGLLFNNTGGDSLPLSGLKVPGEVKLGIAPAGTPPSEVPTGTTATVASSGSFTGSLSAPGPGSYVVVARSCWGEVETLRCAEGSSTVDV